MPGVSRFPSRQAEAAVRDRQTREPLAPYGSTSPEMTLIRACVRRGLLPFVNVYRLHVCPPLTITGAEAREGLTIIDEALSDVEG